MQTALIVAGEEALVFVRDNAVFANSLDVAAYFKKRHDHVVRSIERLVGQGCAPNFGETFRDVQMPKGGTRRERSFDMDRRGFIVLAMGFTGDKALAWKLRYIDAFEAMEGELRQAEPKPLAVPQTLPEALRLAADLADQNERQRALLAVVEPKAEALDRISTAKGSLCVTDTAKTLGKRRKDLFAYMRGNGWLYRRGLSRQDRAYDDKLAAGLLEQRLTDPDEQGRTFDQVRVTPKGVAALALALNGHARPAQHQLEGI